MTVYFAFLSNERARRSSALEFAPNLAIPARCLQDRARQQRSKTYRGGVTRSPVPQPEAAFPSADMSARMLVWRRAPGQPAPERKTPPDEVWSLTPAGRVVRDLYPLGRGSAGPSPV